jgi:hypothetical protein
MKDLAGGEPGHGEKSSFRLWVWVVAVALIVLVGSPWVGVFLHREYLDWYVFIKHRPSLIFVFRSPYGLGDRGSLPLSEEKERQEALFEEFVERGGGVRRSLPLPGGLFGP